jgi:hypothetical protein
LHGLSSRRIAGCAPAQWIEKSPFSRAKRFGADKISNQ